MATRKLIVASTRLPLSVTRKGSGWTAKPSPGGLATALRSLYRTHPFTWVGWPGAQVPPEEQPRIKECLCQHEHAAPVFIDEKRFEGFYSQLSNRLLWPLFHGFFHQAIYDRDAWEQYRAVNEMFAAAIAEHVRPGDAVWVHDYQLALVPQLLRERDLDCGIGFFLHIPFPSAEIYRKLPIRERILLGLLGADLIGFHSYEFVGHFRSACLRVLGLESDPDMIHQATHGTRLAVLPIGIDPDEMTSFANSERTRRDMSTLRCKFAPKRVIVGIDRLDYTKGIPQKLHAFEELLAGYPEWRGRVVLVQVAAPSRMRVEEYQQLKSEVDELVGDINGRYGTMQYQPVVYINQMLSRERLTALYRIADVSLITPLRDGMNLVALEYVAARGSEPGTLVLSEFAGAASCLPGARIVNPHNAQGVAEVLAQSLSEPPSQEAWQQLGEFVQNNTAEAWAKRFLQRLETHCDTLGRGAQRLIVKALDRNMLVVPDRTPLLLLDYDGTLQPHATLLEQARPSPETLELLQELSEYATVYVVSGRPAGTLDEWLGHLPIGMVSEHGLAVKHPGEKWPTLRPIDRTLLDEVVRPLMADFTERTPGSRIEEKQASIAWHYRAVDPKFGAWRAKELRAELEERLRGHEFNVLVGSRVIEVRHQRMSKAHAVREILNHERDLGLIFCAGNDRTDEEMFEALQRSSHTPLITCRVERRHTSAAFFVRTPGELVDNLRELMRRWAENQLAIGGGQH